MQDFANFLRLGGPKHDTCWYWLAQGFTSFFFPMRTERVVQIGPMSLYTHSTVADGNLNFLTVPGTAIF